MKEEEEGRRKPPQAGDQKNLLKHKKIEIFYLFIFCSRIIPGHISDVLQRVINVLALSRAR